MNNGEMRKIAIEYLTELRDSRQKVLPNEAPHYEAEKDMDLFNIAIKALEERPTGHWIPKVCNFYWYRQFACSECEHEIICRKKTPYFCEECGADMRGERR